MKKNHLQLWLLVATIVLSSCKKENTGPGSISVKLSATTFYKNGSEETRFERSGTIEKSSYAKLVDDAGTGKFLVNLGAAGETPNISAFGISFLFNRQTGPDTIRGIYTFPQDQLLIRTGFRNEVTQTITETIFQPTRGKVSFLYDRSTGKISGSIENLEFSIIPNDPYNRYRITVSGNFENVGIR